jgi:hypothetical protein
MPTSHKVTGMVWDNHMNRSGIEAYVVARYFSAPASDAHERKRPRNPSEAASLRHPPNLGASITAVNQ